MQVRDSIHDNILCERISNNIYLDNNGQLICENVTLARTGYYDYREDELLEGGSSDKIIHVYRSPDEVFDPVSMNSMNYKPLVDEHPDENITPDTVGELQKGFMTNVRRGTGEFSDCLMADLVVTDPYVIDLIRNNEKRDLSVGYTADIVEENGEYVMKKIRGNHIALCEAGRAGNARIRDSKSVYDMSYEAKGSFNSVKELESHYKGSTTESTGDGVIVRLKSGTKLLYKFVSGGKLAFIRTMHDSVEVLGDSIKLREGQRVEYFGTPCEVSEINSNLATRKFMVTFTSGAISVGRLDYDEVVQNVNQGKIRLLDSVVFDSELNSFILEQNDTHDAIGSRGQTVRIHLAGGGKVEGKLTEVSGDNFEARLPSGKLVEGWFDFASGRYFADAGEGNEPRDPADEKELDRTHFIAGDSSTYKSGDTIKAKLPSGTVDTFTVSRDLGSEVEVVEKTNSGRTIKYRLNKSQIVDNLGVMKSFRVSVNGRTFDTRATSAAHAVKKVKDAVSNELKDPYTLYSKTNGYLHRNSSIPNNIIFVHGPYQAIRLSKIVAENLVRDLNLALRNMKHKDDFTVVKLTAKDLGVEDSFVNDVPDMETKSGRSDYFLQIAMSALDIVPTRMWNRVGSKFNIDNNNITMVVKESGITLRSRLGAEANNLQTKKAVQEFIRGHLKLKG